MTAAEVVLSYHNVTKSFGAARALDGVELEIERGEIFGFIGPDGAGGAAGDGPQRDRGRGPRERAVL